MSRVRWDDMMGKPTYGSEKVIPPGYRSAMGSDRLGDVVPDIEALVDRADVPSPVACVEHEPPEPMRATPGVMVKV
jgi:hypothetical protein